MDPDRLERLTRLGLHDPAADRSDDRLALLELLVADGASDAEMVAAEAEGRLFALSGDRFLRPIAATYSTEDAARALGLDHDAFLRIWHAIGLPRPEPGTPELTAEEVEGVGVLRDVANLLGIEAATSVARVAGAAMGRIAEAESSAVRQAMLDIDLDVSQSEATTAVAWRATAELIPKIGRMLDVVHRRHLDLVRTYFESVSMREAGTEATLGVGFVDLSGFTALSATSTLPTLSRLLSIFEERATDTVVSGGGRLVKFLGDAVMYVTADRGRLARIALALVHDPVAAEAGITVRGGIAWGDVLVQDGDYFGSPVNLAARLVSIAPPTTVLASPELQGVEGVTTEVLAAQAIRGFEVPIAPLRISH